METITLKFTILGGPHDGANGTFEGDVSVGNKAEFLKELSKKGSTLRMFDHDYHVQSLDEENLHIIATY